MKNAKIDDMWWVGVACIYVHVCMRVRRIQIILVIGGYKLNQVAQHTNPLQLKKKDVENAEQVKFKTMPAKQSFIIGVFIQSTVATVVQTLWTFTQKYLCNFLWIHNCPVEAQVQQCPIPYMKRYIYLYHCKLISEVDRGIPVEHSPKSHRFPGSAVWHPDLEGL